MASNRVLIPLLQRINGESSAYLREEGRKAEDQLSKERDGLFYDPRSKIRRRGGGKK